MEDNSTIVQLKNALNQLLNAYESLKVETEQLKKDNLKLKEDVQSLEVMNTGLNTRLTSLNDTTDHHSTEMGEMLDRIESILGTPDEQSEESIVEDELFTVSDNLSEDENSIANTEEQNQDKEEEEKTNILFNNNNNNTKDIDLGRMQSLLNGFNN